MKIIFLDMDGVVNRSTSKFFGKLGCVEHGLVVLFNDIVEKTGAKVVFSSSWRRWPQWGNILIAAGFDIEQFVGQTPDNNGLTSRGTEIKKWIDEIGNIEKYAILDDRDDFLKDQFLFRTDPTVGITREIADAVIAHLT